MSNKLTAGDNVHVPDLVGGYKIIEIFTKNGVEYAIVSNGINACTRPLDILVKAEK